MKTYTGCLIKISNSDIQARAWTSSKIPVRPHHPSCPDKKPRVVPSAPGIAPRQNGKVYKSICEVRAKRCLAWFSAQAFVLNSGRGTCSIVRPELFLVKVIYIKTQIKHRRDLFSILVALICCYLVETTSACGCYNHKYIAMADMSLYFSCRPGLQ